MNQAVALHLREIILDEADIQLLRLENLERGRQPLLVLDAAERVVEAGRNALVVVAIELGRVESGIGRVTWWLVCFSFLIRDS
ncbi:hypothetical protein [Accumulibacter sp.]|uniref:hypothetical protein n=1 Tax=Accumulibacter sp. TaxID=2053492 RepID=UPI0035B0EE23